MAERPPERTRPVQQTAAVESRPRLHAERTRHDTGEHRLSLLDEIEDVIWTAPGDGTSMSFINNACERVYGRPASEFRDNPNLWLEVVHPDDLGHIADVTDIQKFALGDERAQFGCRSEH